MSIISSRFSYSVLLSAAVASECVMAGVCLTDSSEVVLDADIDGVSGHKFEGSLKKVGPDHHNSLSTRSFPEPPHEGMSAGFMFPGQNLHFSMSVSLRITSTLCWTYRFHGLWFLIQQSVVNESTQ